jgi:hypothetical protein
MVSKHLRCCGGRFCFWWPPLGPWFCGVCNKAFPGSMPRSGEHRFWAYVDQVVTETEAWLADPAKLELLWLFKGVG